MDKDNDNAEALRAAIKPEAECGWGCFCDACWHAATLAEKRHRREQATDALGAELALHDALWRLAFDAYGERAPGVQGA